MRQGEQGADSELPLKAYPDVDRDPEHRESDSHRAVLRQLLADLARHRFAGVDASARILLRDGRAQLADQHIGRCFRSRRLRKPDLKGAVILAERRDAGFASAEPVDAAPEVVDMHRLGELGPHDLTADEVDAEIEAAIE